MDNQNRIALVRLGDAFSDDATPPVKYYLGDHLGSSNLVVDNGGNWANREEYTPYGETSFGSFARKRYRFTGKERDGETGLYYHGARHYAPWLGRWTSCDPGGPADGFNLYQYVRSNPANHKDPSGLQTNPDDPDAGAQDPEISDAGAGDAKPNAPPGGGVKLGEGGYDFHDYAPDAKRIKEQGVAVKGAVAGFLNTAKEAAAKGLKDVVKEPAKSLLPNVPDVVLDELPIIRGINRRIDALSEKLTLEAPNSPAGGGGYIFGMFAFFTAENLVNGGISRLASKTFGPGQSTLRAGATGAPDDAVTVAKQLADAPGTRVFYSGPSCNGTNACVAARFNGNRVTFDTKTDGQFTEVVFSSLRITDPKVAIVSGSGTHATMGGAWAASDAAQARGARAFYFQDIKSLGGRGGPNYVYNVGTEKGISGFLNHEQSGSDITVRSWCFSTLSRP
jgi:RHS repeat-associated protein